MILKNNYIHWNTIQFKNKKDRYEGDSIKINKYYLCKRELLRISLDEFDQITSKDKKIKKKQFTSNTFLLIDPLETNCLPID